MYKMEEVRDPIPYKYERLVDTEVKPATRKNRRGENNDDLNKAIQNSMIENISEEQIIDNILSRDIEEIMRQSRREYEEQLQREEEAERLESIRRKELFSKFTNIKTQIKRIGKMDKDIHKLGEIIEPIIDSYCENSTQVFDFDELTYDMIVKNLKTIRIKKEEFELILSIIRPHSSVQNKS